MKHTLLSAVDGAIMYLESDGHPPYRIRRVSNRLLEFTGYSREELIGRAPSIFRGPLTEDAVTDAMCEALKKGERFEGVITNYKKSGETFVQRLWVDPIRDDDSGNITGFVSVITDVTNEVRQAEQITELAQDLQIHLYSWQACVNARRDGIDLDKKLLFTESQNADDVWGVSDDVVREPGFAKWCLDRIVDPKEADDFIQRVNESARIAAIEPQTEETMKAKVWSWEGTILRPDENGVEKPVRVRARSVPKTVDKHSGACVWTGHMEARELREEDLLSEEMLTKALKEKEEAQAEMERAFDCVSGMGEMGIHAMTGKMVAGELPVVTAMPTGGRYLGIDAEDWIGKSATHNLCPSCLEGDVGPKMEMALSSPEVQTLSALEKRYHEDLKEWRRTKVVARYGVLVEESDGVPTSRSYIVTFQDVEEECRRVDELDAAKAELDTLRVAINAMHKLGVTLMKVSIDKTSGGATVTQLISEGEFLGLTNEEWCGRDALEGLYPEDRERIVEPVLIQLLEKRQRHTEHKERRWHTTLKEWRAHKVYGVMTDSDQDNGDSSEEIVVLFVDITDEQARKTELETIQANFQVLIDTVSATGASAMAVDMPQDKGGEPVVAQVLTTAQFLGEDACMWKGRSVFKNIHPEDAENIVKPNIEEMLAGRIHAVCHIERRWHATLRCWRRCRVAAKQFNNTIEGRMQVMAVHFDVEDEIAAAEAVVRDKADKDAIWSMVGELMVIVHGSEPFTGQILDCNQSVHALAERVSCGGRGNVISGCPLLDMMGLVEKDIHKVNDNDSVATSGNAATTQDVYEFDIITENGDIVSCEATAKVITVAGIDNGDDGSSQDEVRTAVVIRDRTIQKQLEDQKHQTEIQKAQNETLQTHIKWVQHEVKNSALSLQARVQLIQHLLSGFPPGRFDAALDSLQNDLDGLESEVETLLNGVRDQVVFGCLASGTYIAQWSKCSKRDMLTSLLRHAGGFNKGGPDKYILECHGISDSDMFQLDTHAMKHATYNLESNALKYGEKGSLRVCVWMTDSKDTWRECCSRFSKPSELRYESLSRSDQEGEETCVVDSVGDMIPGYAMIPNGASKLYEATHVSHMLCMSFTNEVKEEQMPALRELQAADKLGDLFKEGVRSAGKHNSDESAGDGLALASRVIASLYGRIDVSLYTDKPSSTVRDKKLLFHVRCTVPVLAVVNDDTGTTQASTTTIPSDTTCIVALDDDKMQRVILKNYLKKMEVPHLVLGDWEDHITYPVENLLQGALRVNPSAHTIVCILDQNLGKLETTGGDAPLGTDIARMLRAALETDRELVSQLSGGLHIYIRSANDDGASVQCYMQVADGVIQKQTSWKDMKQQIANRLHIETQVQMFVGAANRRIEDEEKEEEEEETRLRLYEVDQPAKRHCKFSNKDRHGSGDGNSSSDDVDKELLGMMCGNVIESIVDVLPDLHTIQIPPRSDGPSFLSLKDFSSDLDSRLHGLKGALQSLDGMMVTQEHRFDSVAIPDVCARITRIRRDRRDDMIDQSKFNSEINTLMCELEELKRALIHKEGEEEGVAAAAVAETANGISEMQAPLLSQEELEAYSHEDCGLESSLLYAGLDICPQCGKRRLETARYLSLPAVIVVSCGACGYSKSTQSELNQL